MNAETLLHEVEARGVQVRVEGEHLNLNPKSKLDPELIDQLRQHKPELLRLVSEKRATNVLPIATLTREDLKYPIAYVEQQIPTLPSKYRQRVEYWAELILSAGYSQEEALRAAFQRTIRLPRR